MKNPFKNLFKRPKRIVFTFTETGDGCIETTVKADRNIPVGYALTAIDWFKNQISQSLGREFLRQRIKTGSPKARYVMRTSKLGDLH